MLYSRRFLAFRRLEPAAFVRQLRLEIHSQFVGRLERRLAADTTNGSGSG